jgi:hypothetical protein
VKDVRLVHQIDLKNDKADTIRKGGIKIFKHVYHLCPLQVCKGETHSNSCNSSNVTVFVNISVPSRTLNIKNRLQEENVAHYMNN